MRLAHYTLFGAALLFAAELTAQTPAAAAPTCGRYVDLTASTISDARRSLYRALSITSAPGRSDLFRASSIGGVVCAGDFSFLDAWSPLKTDAAVAPLPLEASVLTNSAYPRSVNDGAAWSGVGTNFRAAAGVRGQWRFLRASLAPEFAYQQNKTFAFVPFDGIGRSEFGNPYQPQIDLPTRFGAESFSTLTLGQSYIQATTGTFAATFGTENLWIGAAEVHPILLSYTAPGFPHLRLGTQRPIDLPFVRVELQLLFASLRESDYFNIDPSDDDHYFTSALIVIEPKFVPGLFLGVARAYHDTATATGQSLSYYTSRIIETPFGAGAGGNDIGNALGVLYGRWVHPASGFEAYGEWSREDTPGGWVDALREPDWTQAYVLGVQKTFARPHRLSRLYAELIHLGESAPSRAGRGHFSYYTHSAIVQGHTNEGQLLGAAIGPGSDAQLIGFDMFSASGRTAVRVERTRYDDDTYYRTFARRFGETRHDAEITLSASRLQFVGPVELEAGLAMSRRYGRQFMTEEDLAETNWSLRVGAAWQPKF